MLTIIRGRKLVVGNVIAILALVAGAVVLSQDGDGENVETFTDKGKVMADINLPDDISDRPDTKERVPQGYDRRLIHLNSLDDKQTEEGILPCSGSVTSTDAQLHDAVTTDKAVHLFSAVEGDSARLTAYKRPQ